MITLKTLLMKRWLIFTHIKRMTMDRLPRLYYMCFNQKNQDQLLRGMLCMYISPLAYTLFHGNILFWVNTVILNHQFATSIEWQRFGLIERARSSPPLLKRCSSRPTSCGPQSRGHESQNSEHGGFSVPLWLLSLSSVLCSFNFQSEQMESQNKCSKPLEAGHLL